MTYEGDVGKRLHDSGVKAKERRIKRSDKFNSFPRPPSQWSCIRCGNIQNLSLERLYSCATKNSESYIGVVTCKRCGFQSEDYPSYQPVNIALSSPPKGSIAEELNSTIKNSRRWQEGDSENALTIHEFLYTHPRINERRYSQVMKIIHEEDDRKMPFRPSLPPESEKIISDLKSDQNLHVLAPDKVQVAEYFRKHPVERLYKGEAPKIRKHRETGQIFLRPRKKHIPFIFTGIDHVGRKPVYGVPIESKTLKTYKPKPPKKVNPEVWNGIVQHLWNEEECRVQRLLKKEKEFHSVDVNTGQQLYKPKIPEPLVVEGKVVGPTLPPSSFESILLKEKQRKERKEAEERRRQMAELERLCQGAKVVVNPQSAAIFDEATDKGIEEIFKVLLASVQFNFFDELNLSRAYEITKIANEMHDWRERALDISLVKQGMLIPNVMDLVVEAMQMHFQEAHESQMALGSELDCNSVEPSMSLSYDAFRMSILKCIKHRRSLGLHYAVAPRKRDSLGVELSRKRDEESTFAPDTSRSQSTVEVTRSALKPVEEHLIQHGVKIKSKTDKARTVMAQAKESIVYDFKPQLIKPPSYVRPRYRGVGSRASSMSFESFADTSVYSIKRKDKPNEDSSADQKNKNIESIPKALEFPLNYSSCLVSKGDIISQFAGEGLVYSPPSIKIKVNGVGIYEEPSDISEKTVPWGNIKSTASPFVEGDLIELLPPSVDSDDITEAAYEMPSEAPPLSTESPPPPLHHRKGKDLTIRIPSSDDGIDDTTPGRSSPLKSVTFDERNIEATVSPRSKEKQGTLFKENDSAQNISVFGGKVDPSESLKITNFSLSDLSPKRRSALVNVGNVEHKPSPESPSGLTIKGPHFFGSYSSECSASSDVNPLPKVLIDDAQIQHDNTRNLKLSDIVSKFRR